MADQSSGGSATSFCTAGALCRPATAVRPPVTDAAGQAASCRWVNGTSISARGRPSAQLSSQEPLINSSQRPVFELASTDEAAAAVGGLTHRNRPTLSSAILGRDGRRVSAAALVRRPLIALALVPRPAVLFLAGAVAGAIGKTITAPLDRVKILLQASTSLMHEVARRGVMVSSDLALLKGARRCSA